jgi:hypothetical protein
MKMKISAEVKSKLERRSRETTMSECGWKIGLIEMVFMKQYSDCPQKLHTVGLTMFLFFFTFALIHHLIFLFHFFARFSDHFFLEFHLKYFQTILHSLVHTFGDELLLVT